MNITNLFSGLADAVISEETTAQDGSLALQSETYTFIKATKPALQVGNIVCVCRKDNETIEKKLPALALLELISDGTTIYTYEDVFLGMCRVLGGVAKFGENNTFTKKLTIV